MHADVAAARQLVRRGQGGKLLQVGRVHRRFEVEPARLDAERLQQAHAALDLRLVVAPRQEARRIRTVVTFAKVAGRTPSAQQRDDRIAELAAAVELQRQIEAPRLSALEELEHGARLAALLAQARKSRELHELVEVRPK